MTNFTETTLGTWAHRDGRALTASYLDSETIRVDRIGSAAPSYRAQPAAGPDFVTESVWLNIFDQIRDAGFTHK